MDSHVFIVIPVHNHVEESLACLRCLAAQDYPHRSVIVVDGGSTDGTPGRIAAEFHDVTVLPGDDSLWWTGATAMGIEHARRLSRPGDFILMLNNDTACGPGYLRELVRASLACGRAVTGSLNVAFDDPSRIVDSGVWGDWRTMASWQVPIEPASEWTTRVNTLSGRGMLVPVEVFDRIGNVNARKLPHYAADYEFAFRAARAGFPLALSYKAVLRVHTAITGREGDLATPVSPRDVLHLLFSRRSIRNVRDRLNFVSLACPPDLRLRNYLGVIGASLWLATNVPGAIQLKTLLFRLLLPRRAEDWMVGRKFLPPRIGGNRAHAGQSAGHDHAAGSLES